MARFNWSDFRPSKTLWVWSCVGCVVATMIIGFTVGGWVTGGTADEMASEARSNGRAELVAQICVDRFLGATDAASELAALKEQSTWQRDDFIQKGGWVKLAGLEKPVEGAADLCAEELVGMELPAGGETAAAGSETSVN